MKTDTAPQINEDNSSSPPLTNKMPIDYLAGDVIDQGKIINVIRSGDNFSIFEVDGNHHFSFEAQGLNRTQQTHMGKILTLREKAYRKIKGTLNSEVDNMFINILGNLFSRHDIKTIEKDFAEIESYINNLAEVETVILNSEYCGVWINHKNEVKYWVKKGKVVNYTKKIAEYNRVKTLANALLSEDQLKTFNKRLGAALAETLSSDNSDTSNSFLPIERYLQSIISNGVRIKYLLATSSISVILTLVTYFIQQYVIKFGFLNSALIVIAGGFLGTFISVFERSKTLLIDDCDSTLLILLQGILRVVLGGIFGLIAYSAATTGIAFSIFKDSIPSLILLGIAAGFSERLIPDLIQGFTTNKKSVD